MKDAKISADIAVIIVNYGTANMTIEAVESVLAHYRGNNFLEIHIVDNASPGGDALLLKNAHSARGWGAQVLLHLETTNHGFGRGNNIVLKQLAESAVPPHSVFLLNPDARLDNDVIAILAAELEQYSNLGFVGAGVHKPDGTAVSAAFRFPNTSNTFAQAINFGPLTRLWKNRFVALAPDTPAELVEWVSGAAVMIRFETLQEIGFFDPDFFLYFEEVELMYRGGAHCWMTRHAPQARVIHAEGASTGVKSGQQFRQSRPAYWYRSWCLYHLKTGGRRFMVLSALAWMLGAALNHLISVLRRLDPHAPLHFYGDLWKHGIRPLLRWSA